MSLTRIARPSPNHGARPKGAVVSAVILHSDAADSVEGSIAWCRNPASAVSYHMIIGRNGVVYDLVPSERRAWHAGESALSGVGDCNGYSVGVCFGNKNDGVEPYTAAQVDAAAELCALLIEKYPAIVPARITTHAIVALPPGRKTDPKGFDLAAFRLQVAGVLLAHCRESR